MTWHCWDSRRHAGPHSVGAGPAQFGAGLDQVPNERRARMEVLQESAGPVAAQALAQSR